MGGLAVIVDLELYCYPPGLCQKGQNKRMKHMLVSTISLINVSWYDMIWQQTAIAKKKKKKKGLNSPNKTAPEKEDID